jgi:hypothetical protein
MIQLDINQIQANGDTYFSSTDTGYLIFLVIGIVGYFTIPSVANYIVQAGGGNALLYKVTNLFSSSVRTVVSTANAGLGTASEIFTRENNPDSNGGYFGRHESSSPDGHRYSGGFMANRLSGKSDTEEINRRNA